MKLYTRTGDDGGTALIGGARVAKDNPRVAAYGTVDEANATVGLASASPDLPPLLKQICEGGVVFRRGLRCACIAPVCCERLGQRQRDVDGFHLVPEAPRRC
jgi:hypothetical protein